MDTVVVNGRVVVSGGNLLSADEEDILRKASRWNEKIKAIECKRSDTVDL